MAAFNPSGSDDGKYSDVDPNKLRFTQLTISDRFSGDHDQVKLEDALRDIKTGKSHPEDYPPVEVYKDKDGVMWCSDNRRLYIFRKAGVPSIKVKLVKGSRGKWRSGNNVVQGKIILNDPKFYPDVGGEKSRSPLMRWPSKELYGEEKSESSLPGLVVSVSAAIMLGYAGSVVSVSAALMAGYASWKLYKRTQSDK